MWDLNIDWFFFCGGVDGDNDAVVIILKHIGSATMGTWMGLSMVGAIGTLLAGSEIGAQV
jgi:hypothetical protein